MADGFDECRKKRLVSKPGACDPPPFPFCSVAVSRVLVTEKGVLSAACVCVCFHQYLHPSDPDVNHVDLLTSVLIVFSLLLDSFLSPLATFLNSSAGAFSLFFSPPSGSVCVFLPVLLHVCADRLLPKSQDKC